MTKVRKQKRKKKFRYASKKKLKRKDVIGHSIKCREIKQDWDKKKSVISNMGEMGLVYDVNKAFSIPSNKGVEQKPSKSKEAVPSKEHVAQKLEEEANAPRVSKLRLPEGQVRWLSYLITTYGEDYKAMAKDGKNYYQDTWKQLRKKINTFKKIPEQYNEFLKTQESSSMDTCN